MPEPRSTASRRNARAGLASIRIGPRVYWVPTKLAREIERMCVSEVVRLIRDEKS